MSKDVLQYRAWEGTPLHNMLCKYLPAFYSPRRKLDSLGICEALGWGSERLYNSLRYNMFSKSTVAGLVTLCNRYDNVDLLLKANLRPEDFAKELSAFVKKGPCK